MNGGGREYDGKYRNRSPLCLISLEIEGREELSACEHAFHAECLAGWRQTCETKKLVPACP